MEFLKHSQRYYTLKWLSDGIVISGLFLLIIHGRFGIGTGEVPRPVWVFGALLVGCFWLVGYLRGDYSPSLPVKPGKTFIQTGTTFFIAISMALFGTTFLVAHHLSRLTLGLSFLLGCPLICLLRFLYNRILNLRLRKDPPRILFAGAGAAGQRTARKVDKLYGDRVDIVGFLDDNAPDDFPYPVLGELNELEKVVGNPGPDTLFISISNIEEDRLFDLLDRARDKGIGVKILSELFDIVAEKVSGGHYEEYPIVDFKKTPFRGLQRFCKRGIDIVGGTVVLFLSLPFMVAISCAIKLNSEGPAIYTDDRYRGRDDTFEIYKFRTMYEGADEEKEDVIYDDAVELDTDEFTYKVPDDPRITEVGKWLRRFSLDELPQLINVIKGDMSLVGPRPPATEEEDYYEEWHRRRLDGKPGLTGLWQVSGRNELTMKERALLDVYYLENWTLLMDTKILLKTIPAVLSGRGAY
ncbi:MAG: sugar transferase [bacterium]